MSWAGDLTLAVCALALCSTAAVTSQSSMFVNPQGSLEAGHDSRGQDEDVQMGSAAGDDYVLVPFLPDPFFAPTQTNTHLMRSATGLRSRTGEEAQSQELIIPTPVKPMKCFNSKDSSGNARELTIITNFARTSAELGECIIENRKLYAQSAGIEACIYDSALDDELSFSWQKWMAVKSLFEASEANGGPRSMVWWLDADAFIMQSRASILAIAARHADKEAIFTTDYIDCGAPGAKPVPGSDSRCESDEVTNAGSFILRNALWSRKLVDTIFDNRLAGHKGMSDRLSLENWREHNLDEYKMHFAIVPMRDFNSLSEVYQEGDFVFHIAGSPTSNEKSPIDSKWRSLSDKCTESLHNLKAN
eukprot:TRINITY_DN77096_c0_g1_i1.p1 TRINITY_DN77096_c0_g1~~TRINITY_DN77096_c0_g1_i1.p1  ORF type:complete len:361 (+),score=40.97 TRINITY_DN77096_c0_g1_i1:66-1148(+)